MAKPTMIRTNPKPQIPSPKSQPSRACGIRDLDLGIWDLVRATSLVEDLVEARNRRFLEADARDVAVMRLVRGQVDAFGCVSDRHLLIVQHLRLAPQVAQECLEVRDLLLALERLAVAGHDGFEIDRLQLLEVVRPLVVEAEVEPARRRPFEEAAGGDHLLLPQETHDGGAPRAPARVDQAKPRVL